MALYTQANRPLSVTTPLGPDALLLEKFSGVEALSQPFNFRLDLLAERAVAFDKLIGQSIVVELRPPHASSPRYFHGMVSRLYQAGRIRAGAGTLIRYRLDMVPQFWALQKRVRSRIFHNQSAPEILQQLLKTEWSLNVSQAITAATNFPKHNYRVQYQESDFAFASRLMEESGLFYYFKHTQTGHEMVIADNSTRGPDLAEPASARYDDVDGGARTTPRIREWEKFQELCPGKFALNDYHFELPTQDLTAQHAIADSVAVGTVAHSLKIANQQLEINAYPGGYTSHFDSVGTSAMASVSSRLDGVYSEKTYRAKIGMERAAAETLQAQGGGDCGHFSPGFKFTLANHFDADGAYVLSEVEHSASIEGSYTSSSAEEIALVYTNRFRCLPAELPYRPPCRTERPRITGTQTAVVIGTPGIDPPVDPYGRVRVEFHWESGKTSPHSCWVRVGQAWAGNRFGAFFWPRIGHEVIVAFEDGDPDRPIIVGSVYNAQNMPPLQLPANSSASGFRSCSIGGDPIEHSCSITLHDLPGDEHVHIHSEKHGLLTAEASGFHRQPGRHLEVVGSFPVSAGSGSGGGLLEWGSVSESNPLSHFEHENLPGKYLMIAGDNTGITLGGRFTQILGGSEVKQSCDLEAILVGGILSKLHSPLLQGMEALALGVGGDSSLTYGPKVSSIYNGPVNLPLIGHMDIGQKIDIIRGEELKFSNKGFDGVVGKLCFAFNALTLGCGLAGAIWTYVNARTNQPSDSGHGSSGSSNGHASSNGSGGGSGGSGGNTSGGGTGGGSTSGGGTSGGGTGGGSTSGGGTSGSTTSGASGGSTSGGGTSGSSASGGSASGTSGTSSSSSSGSSTPSPYLLGNITKAPGWAKALSTTICLRMHALLNLVETAYGRAKQAEKMAKAAATAAESAAKLVAALPLKGYAVPQADLAKDYVEAAAQATAAMTMSAMGRALEAVQQFATGHPAGTSQTAAADAAAKLEKYAGSFSGLDKNYTLAARNVSFLVTDPTPPVASPPPSGIDLAALGTTGEFNGHICGRASGGVLMTAGGDASLGLKTSATGSQINLLNSKTGTIEIQQGILPVSPFVKLDETSVYLQSGTDETSCSRLTVDGAPGAPYLFALAGNATSAARLRLDGTDGDQDLELTVGPSATATSVKLTTTGITLTFGKSSLTLSASGITLKTAGARVTLTATDVTVKGVNVTATASAQAKMTGATVTLNGSGALIAKGGIMKLGS